MLSSDNLYPNVNSRMEAWKYSKIESFLKLKHADHAKDDIAAIKEIPDELKALLSSDAKTILFYNGESLTCPSGLDLNINNEQRLNLVYLYGNRINGETRPAKIKSQNRINISAQAQVKIFEAHIALNDIEFSLEQETCIVATGEANVERVKCFWLGDDSYAYDLENIEVKDKAQFLNLIVQMGGKWSRIEQHAKLCSEGSSYKSLGAYLLSGSGHCDLTTSIEHIVGNNNSEQLFKGLVAEKSRSAFTGRILINQDAQKSSTAQLNQNVILGDRAEADSRPQLEVYADDVTASHGTTIGGLNAEEIFYLQSRGISKNQSTEIVAKAFVGDLAERLDDRELGRQAGMILSKGFTRYIKSALEAEL